jgi:hypothetical protein
MFGPDQVPAKIEQLPNALDEPDVVHPPQALPPHHWRRVRQLRRVYLEFLPPGYTPYFFLHPAIYLPVNSEGVS